MVHSHFDIRISNQRLPACHFEPTLPQKKRSWRYKLRLDVFMLLCCWDNEGKRVRLMGGRDACDRRGVRVNRVSVVCFPLSLFLSSFSSHYIPVLGVKWSERCLCQGLDIEVFCAVTLSSKKSAKICNRTRFSPCVQISFSTYFRSLFPFTFFLFVFVQIGLCGTSSI